MAYQTFDRIMQLATGYWQAAALNSAVALGVFEALDHPDAQTAEQVADRCGLSLPHTRDLLDALVGLELLAKCDNEYVIAESCAEYLRPTGAKSMLGALAFNAQMYGLWGRLDDAIRTGKPAVPPEAHLGGDAASTRRFVMGMHSRALGLAEAIVPAIDVAGCHHLLDIGAGPGTFSRMLAERHATLRVTMLDLPPVLEVAKELTAASPAANRIHFHPGSYREGALPTNCDGMLYCGALHQETEDSASDLFARMHDALAPGGSVQVVDLMTDADGATPAFSRLFSINMKLFNPTAGVFTAPRTAELLTAAGFEDVSFSRIAPSPYWRVCGKKAP